MAPRSGERQRAGRMRPFIIRCVVSGVVFVLVFTAVYATGQRMLLDRFHAGLAEMVKGRGVAP